MINQKKHITERRAQDSVSSSLRKSGFDEDNKSGSAQRKSGMYIDVHEHLSSERRAQDSVKTRFSPLGIYIHWPFCLSKCPYCDFFSGVKKCEDENALIQSYIEDLKYFRHLSEEYQVQSIFFGGGTPSLIHPQNIERIIDCITSLWPYSSNMEVSLEANPNSNHLYMFRSLKTAGINRLSLGVQALNSDNLKFLGRTHNLQQALQALEEITHIFDNHSADLIYALPHQKLKDWKNELQQITNFGLKHISLYQLTIEDGTFFAKKGIQPLEENAAAEMYSFTCDYLNHNGYPQYEVSNFAAPGFASIHNLGYWQGLDYIGIGQSAHGRIHINKEPYAQTHPRQLEKLTPQERAEELIIMGMRLIEGLNKQRFFQICGINFDSFIDQKNKQNLLGAGLISDSEHTIKTTAKGLPLLNRIIEELCC